MNSFHDPALQALASSPRHSGVDGSATGPRRAGPASSNRGDDEDTFADSTVFVVDDDPSILELVAEFLTAAGLKTRTFADPQNFLDAYVPGRGCLLLDVRMPGMSGLDLLDRLNEQGISLPVIILTAYGDLPTSIRAMRAGAIDFIEKPCSGEVLVSRVKKALARKPRPSLVEETGKLMATLTSRERQVLELVVDGKPNKAVAADLGISIKTVEKHRASLMRKMQARNLADLLRRVFSARD